MQTKSFLVNPANWEEVKECLIRDAGVIAICSIHFCLRVASKFVTKQSDIDYLSKFGLQKIKTKTHHIRVFFDNQHTAPLIIIKPRGLLKLWRPMSKQDMPEFVADQVFDPDCSAEKRKRLLGKIVGLKAFW